MQTLTCDSCGGEARQDGDYKVCTCGYVVYQDEE